MRYLLRNLLILLALLACISFFLIPEFSLYSSEEISLPSQEIPQAPKELPPPAIPVGLLIENIGVVAPVESVGILGKAMAVPSSSTDVGWYSLGVKPGEVGTAVFAGHVNWYGGKDAVFTNLHLLQVGDIVSVMY